MSGAGSAPECSLTAEGGFAVRLVNKTGAATVKGTVVSLGSVENSFIVTPGDAEYPSGVVLESSVPDGSKAWVVVAGAASVLLKDGEAATAGYWVGVSDTAGRCLTANAVPGTPTHNREVGHCLKSATAGTNVLTRVLLHFN